jgi:SprT-like family
MALKLTPIVLRKAYDFLASTEPFCRWRLPNGDTIKFRILRAEHTDAYVRWPVKGKTELGISATRNGHVETMLASMAHEMIHLHEADCKIRTRNDKHHGAAFRKWAKQVCAAHGFDYAQFI